MKCAMKIHALTLLSAAAALSAASFAQTAAPGQPASPGPAPLAPAAPAPKPAAPKPAPAKPDLNLQAGQHALAILQQACWTPLFNGQDLSNWTGDVARYQAKDGLLICPRGAGTLFTAKDYSDFALRFQFKLEESGNSGIGIRVPEGGHGAYDGMEIQILDHNGSRYQGQATMGDGKTQKLSWLKPWQYHGSIYGIYPAKPGYLKPAGEWNEEVIVAIEDHIMVILNGALIVDAFLEDLTPVDGHDHPGMRNRTGRISLLGHSDYVEFRNLEVVDYKPSAPMPQAGAPNVPPAGFAALFNGTDLSGWKGLAHPNAPERRALQGDARRQAQEKADQVMKDHWSVVEGILTYDGAGQSLCTDRDYGDFELYVDWKIPPGADSGLYLRGTPQIQIWDPWSAGAAGAPLPADAAAWVTSYKTGRNLGSGGLWNNRRARNSPLALADKPAGEWNTFFIRMVGDKVSIWLNGKLVVDRTRLENYWDKEGKTPLARADQIELQHHGSALYFRNLFLRELPY